MTFLTLFHFVLLVGFSAYAIRCDRDRGIKGGTAGALWFIIAITVSWPAPNPAISHMVVHFVLMVVFFATVVSRTGLYITLLFSGLMVVDFLNLAGAVSAENYPHFLGGGFITYLVLMCKACHDRMDYRPLLDHRSFDGDGGDFYRTLHPAKVKGKASSAKQ